VALLQELSLSYNPPSSSAITLRESYPLKKDKSSFKWRHLEPSLILLCVRWYCRYQLSYRDVEEMMPERGLDVDHSTVSDCVKTRPPYSTWRDWFPLSQEIANMLARYQHKAAAHATALTIS
jgi:hypothetical protein